MIYHMTRNSLCFINKGMSARNHIKQKLIPVRDENAGLGFAREKTYIPIYFARPVLNSWISQVPKTTSIYETVEYNEVTPECTAICNAGCHCIEIPHWANRCIISLTGGGGGGSGASISGAIVYAGSGGGAAAAVLDIPVNLNKPNGHRYHHMIIEIGEGGCGGLYSQPGQNGGSSIIKLDDTVIVTAVGGYGATLNEPGLGGKSFHFALHGENGNLGGTTIGSQGSPIGGAGGSSIFSLGGAGGIPTSESQASGSSGNTGGSGGGGGSPWGASGKGGCGGIGYAQIQWIT